MNLQQSELYRTYIEKLNWKIILCDGTYIFIKRIPLMRGLAKLQRTTKLPEPDKLLQLLKQHKIKALAVEPETTVSQKAFDAWIAHIRPHVRINTSAYLPTKTLIVDLKPKEEDIFRQFTEAKRRAVRRAIKYGIKVKESTDIQRFIRVKNKSAGFLGFITTYGAKELWDTFSPDHASLLLAGTLGGIFLLFHNKTAYYWLAGATGEGKKKFAPTLIAWEAIKLAKKRECTAFDFVGVWDERTPKQHTDWLGFTKFKEGFGGAPRYYPVSLG